MKPKFEEHFTIKMKHVSIDSELYLFTDCNDYLDLSYHYTSGEVFDSYSKAEEFLIENRNMIQRKFISKGYSDPIIVRVKSKINEVKGKNYEFT